MNGDPTSYIDVPTSPTDWGLVLFAILFVAAGTWYVWRNTRGGK